MLTGALKNVDGGFQKAFVVVVMNVVFIVIILFFVVIQFYAVKEILYVLVEIALGFSHGLTWMFKGILVIHY